MDNFTLAYTLKQRYLLSFVGRIMQIEGQEYSELVTNVNLNIFTQINGNADITIWVLTPFSVRTFLRTDITPDTIEATIQQMAQEMEQVIKVPQQITPIP